MSFFKEMDLSADFLDADFLIVAPPINEEEKFDVILLQIHIMLYFSKQGL